MASILVVDDDALIRSTVSEALRDEGYDVAEAENGAQALSAVQRHGPDLIVLDLMMPVMDGWEFLRNCGALEACAGRPVIVMSAAHQSALGDLSAAAFVAKPFDLGHLLDVVDRLATAA